MQVKTEDMEGVIALEKLQRGEHKVWTKEEIENSDLPDISKEISYFIARRNTFKEPPSTKEIRSKFKLHADCNEIYLLKKRRIIFNVTIPDIIKFYGPDYLGLYHSHNLPQHLKWLYPYLNFLSRSTGKKGGGGVFSWSEKSEFSRSLRYSRYWIALLELDRVPCYHPLGLHIPK